MVGVRAARMRTLLRLALRDAARHRGRSLLAVAVIAVPLTMILLVLSSMTPPATDRDTALGSLPEGTDGIVTATASTEPLTQRPESIPPWIDQEDRFPASPSEISADLPDQARLLEWWNSPTLLMTTDLALDPGDQSRASSAAAVGELDAEQLRTLTLHEASPEALDLLLPPLVDGSAPSDGEGVVISRAAAEHGGLKVGDTLQLLAPPDTGWRSTDGRIAAVMENSARGYTVAGIADGDAPEAWALPEWVAPLTAADQSGVSRHFLLLDAPDLSWQQVRDLNSDRVGVISRAVLEDYPPHDELPLLPLDPSVVLARIVLSALAVVGAAVLLVLLVTPALTIGAERQRRTMALMIAQGANPRDAARIHLGQGAVLGLLGSSLALLLALAGIPLLRALLASELGPAFGPLPWYLPACLLIVGPLLGVGASLPPTIAAARLDPIAALAARRPAAGARRRSPAAVLAAGAIAAAGATILLLAPALPTPLSGIVLVPGSLLLLLGALLMLPGLFGLAGALGDVVPGATMLRVAARDASRHLGRTAPAASAVLACTASLVLVATATASFQASRDLEEVSMVAPGRATIGMETPISDEVDRSLIASVLTHLADEGLVADHASVLSSADGTWLEPAPAPGRACPSGEGPDTMSAIDPDAPLLCVPEEQAYQPGLTFPSWIGNELTVMAPEDLRATGLDGAEEAADVVAAGGAVVNDATRVSVDGTVELLRGDSGEPLATVPGAFVSGFEPAVTISPETARAWGIPTRYVGEVIVPTDSLQADDLEELREAALAESPVVQVSGKPAPDALGLTSDRRWTLFFVGAATVLAAVATLLSMALGRGEYAADLTTMESLGATPAQRRHYGAMQALVLLLAGLPTGMLVGFTIALPLAGTGLFGVFLTTSVHRLLLATGLAVLVLAVGASAAVLARPSGDLIPRTQD